MELDKEISKSNNFIDRWKWFSIMEKLSMGDITKMEMVEKQNYIGALNLLSFWKERDDRQRAIERINNRRIQH